jgi:hypothetical protein
VRVGLQGGDEAVDAERDDAGAHPDRAAVFTDALPDQPCATDFGDRGRTNNRIERVTVMAPTLGDHRPLRAASRWVPSARR